MLETMARDIFHRSLADLNAEISQACIIYFLPRNEWGFFHWKMILQAHTRGTRDGHCYWARHRVDLLPSPSPAEGLTSSTVPLSQPLPLAVSHTSLCVCSHTCTHSHSSQSFTFRIILYIHYYYYIYLIHALIYFTYILQSLYQLKHQGSPGLHSS